MIRPAECFYTRVSCLLGLAHIVSAFANLLHVGLLQQGSLLGLDDSIAHLRTSRPCAPTTKKKSVANSQSKNFFENILLGLGLDLLLDGSLSHGYIVRGEFGLDKVAMAWFVRRRLLCHACFLSPPPFLSPQSFAPGRARSSLVHLPSPHRVPPSWHICVSSLNFARSRYLLVAVHS